jgi:hypothetical protein
MSPLEVYVRIFFAQQPTPTVDWCGVAQAGDDRYAPRRCPPRNIWFICGLGTRGVAYAGSRVVEIGEALFLARHVV